MQKINISSYLILLIILLSFSCTTAGSVSPESPAAEMQAQVGKAASFEVSLQYHEADPGEDTPAFELPFPEAPVIRGGTPVPEVIPPAEGLFDIEKKELSLETSGPPKEKKVIPIKKPAPLKKKKALPIKKRETPQPLSQKIPDVKKDLPIDDPEPGPGSHTEVLAKAGDEIEIILKGDGWIFPGFLREEDVDGLSFLFRETNNNETRFIFKTEEEGNYSLKFLLQDNYSGSEREKLYRIRVVSDPEFTAFLSGGNSGSSPVRGHTPSGDSSSGDYKKVESLYDQGKYVQALSGYLKNYDAGSPYLNERIADIYEKLEDYEVAADYRRKNLDAGESFRNEAVSGLLRGSVKSGDLNTVLKYMGGVFDTPDGERGAIEVARFLEEKDRPALSINLLHDYLDTYRHSGYLDEVYYMLGRLYEQDNSRRDLKLSREYYTKVYEEFPGSRFAGKSSERVKYLNRHFLYVY